MNAKLIVNGMHCDACVSLITMELEDAGLADHLSAITLQPENQGAVELRAVTDEQLVSARDTINNLDRYSVASETTQ